MVMTEVVNFTFIEDMSTLLSSCVEGKKLKTFFEIDKEFENMMTVVATLVVTTIPASTIDGVHTGKRARMHKNGKTSVPKVVIMCTVCKKNGHDDRVASSTPRLQDDILKSEKSNKEALLTVFGTNEPNEEFLNCVSLKHYRACTGTYDMLSSRFHARSVVLDQVFVLDTTVSILDSGTMTSIIQGTQGTGFRVQLVGVTGDGIQAEITDVTFPVITSTNEFSIRLALKLIFPWGDLMTLVSVVFCTRLRVFLSSRSFTIICGISLRDDPQVSCRLVQTYQALTMR